MAEKKHAPPKLVLKADRATLGFDERGGRLSADGTTREIAYSREIADTILDRLAVGESLTIICRDPGMPTELTVRRWVSADRDGFMARYRQAREVQMESWADKVVTIAEERDADPNDRRVRIDAYKWIASKLAPRRFGDRVTHVGDADNPLIVQHRNTSLDGLSGPQLDLLERFCEQQMNAVDIDDVAVQQDDGSLGETPKLLDKPTT